MASDADRLGATPGIHTIWYLAYSVAYGVLFNLSTTIFALFAGLDPLTRAAFNGPIVAVLLLLNKLTLLRPFSGTMFIGVASLISIFTATFGPPHPYKLVFILAGFAYDLGTLFRTRSLRAWNLGMGVTCYGVAVGILYVTTIGWIAPQLKSAVAALITPAVLILVVAAWILAFPLTRILRPAGEAPGWVERIRASVRP